jgi:hypothetical protein
MSMEMRIGMGVGKIVQRMDQTEILMSHIQNKMIHVIEILKIHMYAIQPNTEDGVEMLLIEKYLDLYENDNTIDLHSRKEIYPAKNMSLRLDLRVGDTVNLS